jgi:serine acetyltransferase
MRRQVIVQLLLLPLPWSLRSRALTRLFGYEFAPSARIGLAIVASRRVRMADGSYIGHGTVARGMDNLDLGPHARIGPMNWIYAIPSDSKYLAHESERRPELVLHQRAGITSRHLVDCSGSVTLDAGALVAGYRSQIISHQLDIQRNRQSTRPIHLGRCSMVGTGSIVLGGSRLPACSVLGAGSTLRSAFEEPHGLYSGVPAQRVAELPATSRFFIRDTVPLTA